MRTKAHSRLYELSSRVVLTLLRTKRPRAALTRLAKIWLRQARLVEHLVGAPYDSIVDGGASIGEFAALARLACPRTPLLCVEPHPESAVRLRHRGFTVIEAALWSEPGHVTLVQPTSAATSCTVVGPDAPERPCWTVESVRLDQLSVPGRKILVKLDLQGAEPQALEGMSEMWDRCGGLLLEVSYGERGTYEPLRTQLASRGFFEAATFNELETDGRVVEADKLWRRRRRR